MALVAVVACGSTGVGAGPGKCKTDVTGGSSPTTGALTLTGQFYADETVLLQYYDAQGVLRQASGTPTTNRTSFTLTGLPSGTLNFIIKVSCADGQVERGTMQYIIK